MPQYVYGYFVKDYLDDIRMVLTEKSDTALYAATMETGNSAVENALFSNIDNTRAALPSGYPSDPIAFVSKLNSNGNKIGPSLVLRVMAGDTVQMAVDALWASNVPVANDAT